MRGAVAIGVGFTVSWHVALVVGLAVLVVRLIEDYLVTPHLRGHAVGLSPLLILVSVLSIEALFGSLAVLLVIPIAAVLATVVDVTLRFVMRWREVTGETLPMPKPADIVGGVELQIVRTVPEKVYRAEPRGDFRILESYGRALRSAQRFISYRARVTLRCRSEQN